jgi:LacI family transcriptional regulator
VGRLVAGYAVERGHRRVGYLAFEHWRPGDNLLIDGINSRLRDEGLGSDALRVRCLPSDPELIESESRRLLQLPDQPTAIIARTLHYAEAAWRAASAMNIRVPEDLLIVAGDGEGSKAAKSRIPSIQFVTEHRRVVAMAGELLLSQFNKQPIVEPQIRLDVKVVDPFRNT